MIIQGEFGESELRCGLGGGGGAGSGGTELPQYMKDFHYWMLNHGDLDPLIFSYNYIASKSFNESPFSTMLAYEPAARVANIDCYASQAISQVVRVDPQTEWQQLALASQAIAEGYLLTDDYITNQANAFNDLTDDEIEQDILPRFQRGMQDINSVMSSTFVIGEAVIEAQALKLKAKHLSDLRLQLARDRAQLIAGAVDNITKFQMFHTDQKRLAYQLGMEAMRVGIVAEKEQVDQDFKIEELDAKWNFEVLTYGANILASMQGAVTRGAETKTNTAASVLGGATTGISGGATVASMMGLSGPAGWAALGIGGLLGGLAGLLG